MPPQGGGAQPVVLTRLHVRYTPNTFPEDLMFMQTKDRQNWQTRYVVQNPYESSVAQCSAKVGQMDCEAMCRPRIGQILNLPTNEAGANFQRPPQRDIYRDKDPLALQRDCVSACVAAKQGGIELASRYYKTDLPRRIQAEKQTLAHLTGWKMSDIDALPGALRFAGGGVENSVTPTSSGGTKPWWEELFKTSRVTP